MENNPKKNLVAVLGEKKLILSRSQIFAKVLPTHCLRMSGDARLFKGFQCVNVYAKWKIAALVFFFQGQGVKACPF